MATLPVEGHWSLRTLGESDRQEALGFLEREPLLNVYLISRILDEGIAGGHIIGVRQGGELVSVAALTSNLVIACAREISPRSRSTVLSIVADRIMTRGIPVRAMISDVELVDELWRLLRGVLDPPTVIRLRQPVYALEGEPERYPELARVRYSELSDLDRLVPACAAMHREEVGIDPLERDALAYRDRIRELILTRRSLILMLDGKIAFKTEYSAVSDKGVQLMGVWTAPSLRRQGWARLGMREVCGHILRQHKKVTLFVNDFNTPAIRLYESLGFRQIGCNRALIW